MLIRPYDIVGSGGAFSESSGHPLVAGPWHTTGAFSIRSVSRSEKDICADPVEGRMPRAVSGEEQGLTSQVVIVEDANFYDILDRLRSSRRSKPYGRIGMRHGLILRVPPNNQRSSSRKGRSTSTTFVF